jgi:hypothetical protein
LDNLWKIDPTNFRQIRILKKSFKNSINCKIAENDAKSDWHITHATVLANLFRGNKLNESYFFWG